MTFYESEIKRIRSIVYSNQGQLDTVIGTRNYIDNNYDTDLNLDLLSAYSICLEIPFITLVRKILWTNAETVPDR
jgi:hypothetical protein